MSNSNPDTEQAWLAVIGTAVEVATLRHQSLDAKAIKFLQSFVATVTHTTPELLTSNRFTLAARNTDRLVRKACDRGHGLIAVDTLKYLIENFQNDEDPIWPFEVATSSSENN